jgi:hypothetical protein
LVPARAGRSRPRGAHRGAPPRAADPLTPRSLARRDGTRTGRPPSSERPVLVTPCRLSSGSSRA